MVVQLNKLKGKTRSKGSETSEHQSLVLPNFCNHIKAAYIGKEEILRFFNRNATNFYKMWDNVFTENNNHNKHQEKEYVAC